jgi:hypothetical protein
MIRAQVKTRADATQAKRVANLCDICNKKGHFKQDCPKLDASAAVMSAKLTVNSSPAEVTAEREKITEDASSYAQRVAHYKEVVAARAHHGVDSNAVGIYIVDELTSEHIAVEEFLGRVGSEDLMCSHALVENSVASGFKIESPPSSSGIDQLVNIDSGTELTIFAATQRGGRTIVRPGSRRKLPAGRFNIFGVQGASSPIVAVFTADVVCEATMPDGQVVRGVMTIGTALEVPAAKKDLINPSNLEWHGFDATRVETGLEFVSKWGVITDTATGCKIVLNRGGSVGAGTLWDLKYGGAWVAGQNRDGTPVQAQSASMEAHDMPDNLPALSSFACAAPAIQVAPPALMGVHDLPDALPTLSPLEWEAPAIPVAPTTLGSLACAAPATPDTRLPGLLSGDAAPEVALPRALPELSSFNITPEPMVSTEENILSALLQAEESAFQNVEGGATQKGNTKPHRGVGGHTAQRVPRAGRWHCITEIGTKCQSGGRFVCLAGGMSTAPARYDTQASSDLGAVWRST